MTSYDLTSRPWIRARTLDGALEEFSLRTVFTQASTIRSLAGELPTQDAAILRLLLAILHRSLDEHRRSADVFTMWGELWERRDRLPVKAIESYLDTWRFRMYLLDPKRPFMQVADLHTAKDEVFGLERLIIDVPSGAQFFTTRAADALDMIDTAEAARWLVHCQAYDPSGIKSGAVGDPRVKGGKGYPIGCGWAGQIGLVIVEGQTLAETLLLNLVLPESGDVGVPIWERGVGHGAAVDGEHPEPTSLIDTLVWQSRRIRLFGDHQKIRGVLISNGDPFGPHDQFRIEAGSGWRRSRPQEKKLKRAPVYMPREHQQERALWRGLEALLATVAVAPSADAPSQISPPVLEWLARLRHDDRLSERHLLRLRAVGLAYGANNSVVDSLINDVVLLHASVLSDPDLQGAAKEAVRHADEAVRALAGLADDLVRAAGGEPDGPKDRAYADGYQVLDRAYREWLMRLHIGCDARDLLKAWDIQVAGLLRPLADRLIADAGTPAFLGRMVEKGRKRLLMDSGHAERNYQWGLRRALPSLPQPSKETTVDASDLTRVEGPPS